MNHSAAIAAAPADLTPDKRILTLVFADLVGSTALAQSLGLEAYDALLTEYHQTAQRIVGQHGGMILQHYGDGVLACFGLTQDAEDAALSGVAAALAMLGAGGKGYNVRAGIHSGSVMCYPTNQGRLSPQITGLDVNLAARLHDLATPGRAVISHATLQFLRRLAKPIVRNTRMVQIKGLSQPLQVAEITGFRFLRKPLQALAQVERNDLLTDILHQAESAGAAFLISGPPGIGKSAFIDALRHRSPAEVIHLSARANLDHTPLLPITDWLRGFLNLQGDSLSETLRTLDLSLPTQDQAALLDALGVATHDEAAPNQRRLNRITALARVIHYLLHQRPHLLLFDDLHWSDADSQQVLTEVIALGIPAGSALVATARPAPAVLAYCAEIGLRIRPLSPLTDQGARAVLGEGMTPAQTEQIIKTAEGNPLFLLSLKAAVGHGPALPQTIEATMQALINAQGGAKDMILKAAVIGRHFGVRQLGYLTSGQPLGPTGGLIEPCPNGWRFSHILLRDVAYQMIPDGRRRQLHAQLSRAIEDQEPDTVHQMPELIADHYLAATDPNHAPPACLRAGLAFLQRADFSQAIRYLTHATAAQGADRLTALTHLAAAKVQKQGFADDDVGAAYHQLDQEVDLTPSAGRERMAALYGLLAHRMIGGQVRSCHELILRMRRAADPADPVQQILRLVNESAYGLYSGRFDLSLQANHHLRNLYDPAQHSAMFLQVGADPLASILSAEVHIHAQRGHLAAASHALEEGLAHLDRLGAALQRPWMQIFGSAGLYFAGQKAEAIQGVAQGCALADAQGAAFWSLAGRMWARGFALLEGPNSKDLQALAQLLDQGGAVGVRLMHPLFYSILAQGYLALDDLASARAASVTACKQTGTGGEGQWAPFVWQVRAKVLQAEGKQQAASRALALARAYARLSGATVWH